MLRKVRITLAALFFTGLTLLFLDFTGTAHRWLSWMASVQALEALLALNIAVVAALVVLTLVFGRIYCSVVCPLGIMQDLTAWAGRKARKNRYTHSKAVAWLRYAVLALFLAVLAANVGLLVRLLAPYSAFGRIMATVFQPLWMMANNVLATLAERADSYAFYTVDVWMKSLSVLVVAVATLVLLAVLSWRNGRTYCNTVCPVGTLLSLLARFAYLKISFHTDKCRNCSLCTKNCKAACIDYKNHTVDYTRCVVCGNCLQSCKFGALRYEHPHPTKPQNGGDGKPDSGRRSFLTATALTATAVLAQEQKKVDGGLAAIEEKAIPERSTELTPPGALSRQHFTAHCTGCQLCVTECPNQVLRPSTDLASLMLPTMSYERGYCRPECTRCSRVCPAGAIRLIDREEKSSLQIGHAVWVKQNCVAVGDGVECGNCARHCPSGAIEMVPLDADDDLSPSVPAINESRCIGCGACEYVCPSRPLPAIYVEGHEVHRHI